MWKILGEDAIYIDIPETWKRRMISLAGEGEKPEKFKKIVGESEVTYMLNGTTEEHTFFIRLSDDVTPEEIQGLADVTLDILKNSEHPCIEVEGQMQKYQVIITNYHEPEIIGLNKTPGMSSGAVFMPIIKGLDSPGRENMNAMRENLWRSLLLGPGLYGHVGLVAAVYADEQPHGREPLGAERAQRALGHPVPVAGGGVVLVGDRHVHRGVGIYRHVQHALGLHGQRLD